MQYVEFGAQENRDFEYEKYVIGERIQENLLSLFLAFWTNLQIGIIPKLYSVVIRLLIFMRTMKNTAFDIINTEKLVY